MAEKETAEEGVETLRGNVNSLSDQLAKVTASERTQRNEATAAKSEVRKKTKKPNQEAAEAR